LKNLPFAYPIANLGPLLANINSNFANSIMREKIKKFQHFPLGASEGSVHPGP